MNAVGTSDAGERVAGLHHVHPRSAVGEILTFRRHGLVTSQIVLHTPEQCSGKLSLKGFGA